MSVGQVRVVVRDGVMAVLVGLESKDSRPEVAVKNDRVGSIVVELRKGTG